MEPTGEAPGRSLSLSGWRGFLGAAWGSVSKEVACGLDLGSFGSVSGDKGEASRWGTPWIWEIEGREGSKAARGLWGLTSRRGEPCWDHMAAWPILVIADTMEPLRQPFSHGSGGRQDARTRSSH